MADIQNSMVSFLQQTRSKFDYYAGGRFLKQQKPKRENKEEEPMPIPPKKKRRFQACLQTKPISSPFHIKSQRKRVHASIEGELANIRVQQLLATGDTNPLNMFERRIRPFKPPPQVTKPPTKDIRVQSSEDNMPKELPMMYNLRSRSYKQLHHPQPIYNTITLYDENYENVEEYKIYKDSERFCGDLVKFSDYAEDCRDCDVQTTLGERQAGEDHSANVLSQTLEQILSMKASELSCSRRINKLLARFNYEE